MPPKSTRGKATGSLAQVSLLESQAESFRDEYQAQAALLQAQPPIVQRFLDSQARQIADALLQPATQLRFMLPDRVTLEAGGGEARSVVVPPEFREQNLGGLMDRLIRSDIRAAFRNRLVELESSPNKAVAAAGSLMRHAVVIHLVHGMLPSGRSVTYVAAPGEEIPTLPAADELEPESAITAATDAIAEEGGAEAGRGELLVPYVPAARRFYLPQWVAFDDEGSLLVNSASRAEAHLASMQRFVAILHTAVTLAPYMVVDAEYQQKRYGMLGQLINQGRALARYLTHEVVETIQNRAKAQDLNRGLSLSLPFFDDQDLEMRTHNFEVIPAGRIMFVPAFVVRAAREEQVKVAQDTRLSASTRKHLLEELRELQEAFQSTTNR